MEEKKDSDLIKVIITEDGSPSLFHSGLNETYHSRHGALQESQYVFIEKGLKQASTFHASLNVLEVGFGTGLNAWLTMSFAQEHQRNIHFTTLETAPLGEEIFSKLHFSNTYSKHSGDDFSRLHFALWDEAVPITTFFIIEKRKMAIQLFESTKKFDVIYYDAFGPPAQPEMWTPEIFAKLFSMMNDGGIFVTYCAKGQVRRDLEACGFITERLPGPPGKREMLRATVPQFSSI